MRFMMIVHGPEDFGKAGPPPQALMDAIGKLGEEAFKSGKMVSMGGLFPSAKGARIRQTGGKLVTTDGPFTEAKEVVGGFSIMELASNGIGELELVATNVPRRQRSPLRRVARQVLARHP